MPNITNLTLSQIQALNQGQLRAAINAVINGWTKRQMILFLMDTDKICDAPNITYRPDKQMETFTEIERDVETGAVTGKRTVTYTYYPTGEMKSHSISWKDGLDKETKRQDAQYFLDGKNPIVIESIAAVIEKVEAVIESEKSLLQKIGGFFKGLLG